MSTTETKQNAGVKDVAGLVNALFNDPDTLKWVKSSVASHDYYITADMIDDQKPGLGYGKVLNNMPLQESTGKSIQIKGFIYTIFKGKKGIVVCFKDKLLPKVADEFDYSGFDDPRFGSVNYQKADDESQALHDKADNADHEDIPF